MRSLILILISLIVSINSQSYTPRPLVQSSCAAGGDFVSYGSNVLAPMTSLTPIAINQLVATLFNITHASTTINQLSLGILDNLQITGIVSLRLGLYQVTRSAFTLIGETREISLYATGSTIIYGDLLRPVVVQPGTYAVTVWSDGLINTIANAVVPATGFPLSYSRFGMPPSYTATTNQASRAVKMVGCSTGVDPWVGADIQYYSFCLSILHSEAASSMTTSTSIASTVQVTVTGVLAVSTSYSGETSQGRWYTITAGKGEAQSIVMSGQSAAVPGPIKTLTSAGGSFVRSYNQRLYATSTPGVDDKGFSLQLNDGTQYIIQYQAGKYEVMVVSPGYLETFQAESATFVAQLSSRHAPYLTCSPAPIVYTPQTFSCPTGTSPVSWGKDQAADAVLGLNGTLSANQLLTNSFTVHVPDTTLYQLTFYVNSQSQNRIQRLRLGLFTNDVLDLTLVAQTQEIVLGGLSSNTQLRANLLQPIRLDFDRNYSIGVIADTPVSAAANLDAAGIAYTGVASYQAVAPSARGFPSRLTGNGANSNSYFMAANGCTTQTRALYGFCAAYLYPDYTQTYSGIVTATANPLNDANGRYRSVMSGSGTALKTYVSGSPAPVTEPFTVNDWNLDGNNHLYEAGANGMLLDEFGLQINVRGTSGYAVQMKSVWNLLSDSWVYKETQATLYGLLVTNPEPLVSSFSYAPYTGTGALPDCGAPPRPANIVQPPSVARASCPNPDTDMADTFGNVDGAMMAAHLDGTLIQGTRLYTQQFTADSPATIRQLAVGILQNADRPEAVRVRLGLYSVASNTLLGQTVELTINQAVPQVIVMNLTSPITINQGETYLVAIQTSAPLEVAHSGVASTPSMVSTFTATGLPSTFTSSGNDVSPAIAAYACASATHSFCGYYQYYTGPVGQKTSVSYFYTGLIQAGSTTSTNAYGTYLPIYAAAGKLSTFRRSDVSVSQTVQVLNFWQTPQADANLYTSSTNNQALDGAGIRLQVSNGAESNLQFNSSINKMDESFAGAVAVYERDLIFSGFSARPLSQAVPECGVGALPLMQEVQVPLPVCENDEEVATYGDANSFSIIGNNNQGSAGMPSNTISLRQITTDGLKWTKLEQIKIPINTNTNSFNRLRLGVYDAGFNFLGGTSDILMTNTLSMMITGVLPQPIYLAPGSIYHLAFWSQTNIYVGFSSVSVPSMRAVLKDDSTPWPSQFTNSGSNSQRALGAIGCFVSGPPPAPSSSSSSTGSVGPSESSQSSKGVESGAVAGIVIGCVIGTNLLLLALIWCCCLRNSVNAGKGSRLEESRVDNSRVEMETV